MKKLALLLVTAMTILSLNAQVSIGVTPYATLQAAFAGINAGAHTGAITVKILASTTETGTAVLNASGVGAANYTSVTIFPTVTGLSILGNLNLPLIDLSGADNVTIDGRVSAVGSTKDLTITNNSTGVAASTIRFIESAQNNTVKYCFVKGASQNTNGGILFFSTATAGTGNDNNLIDNNEIKGTAIADVNRPINCIFSLGTATRENSNNTISNTNFLDFDKAAVPANGININSNNAGWAITGNSFFQTTTVNKTANGAILTVINIANTGNSYDINDNFIGGTAVACGGSPWTTSGAFTHQFLGMLVSAGSSSIQNNTISNLNWSSTNVNSFFGIRVNAGTFDIGSSTGNTIGATTGTGSIVLTNSSVNSTSIAIYIQSTGDGAVANNSIGSITIIGSASISHNFRAIARNSSNILSVLNNLIGSTITANSINVSSSSTNATGQSLIGINSGGAGTLNINGNIISNLNNNYSGTDVAGQVIGIKTANGILNLNNNTITNLSTTSNNPGADASASVIGISISGASAGLTISGSDINNLSNTAAASMVSNYGIYYQGASTGTNSVTGNLIHSLSLSSSNTNANISGLRINSGATTYSNNIITIGSSVSTGYVIHGIYENGTAGNNNNIYFNTVYIGGSPASGSNTAAFYSNANTNTRNFRNNVFDNSRSGGASHYAAFFNYSSAGSLTLNYNDYFASGVGGVLGSFNSANVTSLPLIAAQDANSISIDPLFANAGGTTGADYLPSAALTGTTIAGITVDYLFTTRAVTPTMGAIESSCLAPLSPTDTTPPANLIICNNTSTTLSASGTGTLGWYDAASGGNYLGAGGTFTTSTLISTTSFYVQDSTCAASTVRTVITVNVGSALTSTNSQSNISCFGGANGSATVSVSGGNPAYTYSWAPTGGTTATAGSLFAGTYTCTITDASGCILTETFSITQPTALAAVKTTVNVSCFGGSDGSGTLVVSGGTSPYSYNWTPIGGTAATSIPLPAGAYACTVTDANGCTLIKNFLITQPSPISSAPSQTDVTCNGGADGTAAVVAGGGIAPYTYAWTPSGGTAASASGLSAGSYTCSITDANACVFAQTFTITEPTPFTDSPTQTNISCNGSGDGSITVNISGGTSPYTYAWAPSGGTAATESSLGVGSYTCTVTDASGCTFSETFSITEPTVLTATSSQIDNSCSSGSTASASVVVSGGTPVYSYAWTPSGGTAATATSLASGSYTCTITDANGCVITQTFLITEPTALSPSTVQTDVSCGGGSNGSATVTVSGGTPVYSYMWTPSGGTASTATSLTAGSYTCTVTDANGCTLVVSFNITEPTPITATTSQTNNTCFGGTSGDATVNVSGGTPAYSYSWAPSGGTAATASGLAAGNYTCTITDGLSCSITQTFTITEPAGMTSVNSQTNISCFGGNDGSATVNISGGTPTYTYSWAPTGGTAATENSLTSGSYTCTITDANGCTSTETFAITQPAVLAAVKTQVNVSCFGGSNGSGTVVPSGGTAPYSYSWAPVGGTAATASGLSAGTYTCTITDANGCLITKLFLITQPTPIIATPSQTDVTCAGATDGTATVIAAGGTPGYTYAWTPSGGTAASASGLSAGSYTCTITDANTCTFAQTFTITEPLSITATTSQSDISCNGASDGSATVVAAGGSPAYTYNWTPSGGTAATASGLTAGNYTCTITDANTCSATATFTITEPATITTTNSQTNISCNGASTGSATVVASGGTPTYTYLWTPTGGTAATASGLTAGNYTCTITDANSCVATATFTITEPVVLSSANMQTNVSCFGGNNGDAMVMVSGGTAPYTYNWMPSGGTGATAMSLSAGTYTCTVTDANSCILTETFNITEPTPLVATVASQTDISCFGAANGAASVSVSGGTTAYLYDWTPGNPTGDGTASVTGLTAGTWTCTVTDANSCTTTQTFTITEPASALVASAASQTNISCNGGSNGAASVSVTGGTTAYSYDWTPGNPTGDGTANVTGLTSGTWTCTVTDANSCTTTQTFNITEPTPLIAAVASQTNISCFGGSDGAASVSVSGGTTAYSYDWTPGNPTGDGTASVTGLTAGTWTCTVTDANSCTTTQTFNITEPSVLLASVASQTDISCFGGSNGTAAVTVTGGTTAYSYNWTPGNPTGDGTANVTGLTAGTWTCTVTDANSCTTTQTFNITEPASALVASAASQTNISCNGGANGAASVSVSGGTTAYSYNWTPGNPTGDGTASVTGLTAGTWTCTVTDANSCTTTQTFNITQPSALVATVVSQTNISCNGGSNGAASVSVSGGTSAYSYNWTPGNPTGDGTASVTGLIAGTWTCTVTDANSCTTTQTFNITEPGVLSATISSTAETCGTGNGTATVVASGGTTAYSYSWAPTGGTAATASSLVAGNYTCTITDANSCTTTATVTVITTGGVAASISSFTNVSCNAGTNGSATATQAGGTAPFTYAWSPSGGTSATASGLSAGTYTCLVTDFVGCSGTTTVTITEPTVITVTTSQTDNTCGGGTNGSATVVVSGGTPAYTYNWTPSGGTAATASSLTAGNYTCTITDANSCSATATFNITEPGILSSSNMQTNVSCFGGNNGDAMVMVSGGTPSYTYNWTPSGGTAAMATGLVAGNYTCTITDANSCTLTETFTITEPLALAVTNSQTNILCFGAASGTATVVVSGGTPVYAYNWTPSGGTAATATGLSAGTYTCTITDANSCSTTSTFNITEATAMVSANMQTNVTCGGGNNGDAMVMVSGGTPGYTYNWSPSGGTAATASALTAGTYTCIVTDANGCTLTETFNITEPSTIVSTNMQTNVTCFGGNNGDAMVMVSGGTPGYTYNWSPSGGTGAMAISLTAGTYTCLITDAVGCTLSETFNITEPPVLSSVNSQTNISCFGGNDGSATVLVSGGTPGYTYLWSASGGTAATETGLSVGSFTCTITDANGCISTQTFTITQPLNLTAVKTQTNVSCFGGSDGTGTVVPAGGTSPYTYSWTPSGGTAATETGLTVGIYTCTITDANGCSIVKLFNITQPPVLSASSSQTNISCFGGTNGTATVVPTGGTSPYTYAWTPSGGTAATENGLAAGSYTCTITDVNGCTLPVTFVLTEPGVLSATTMQTNVACFGGNTGDAMVMVSGGTPAYSYAWAPSGGTGATASSLTAGSYTCTITDANSCTLSQTFNITEPPVLSGTLTQSNVTCFGGTNGAISILVAGGVPAYTYLWSPIGGTSAAATSLPAGSYTCTVTDANGCIMTQTATIIEPTEITTSVTQTDVLCFGNANGSASVTATGGTPGYTYLWSPGAQTSSSVTGLPAGSYTCTITDANLCTLDQSFNITQPNALTSVVTVTNVSCQGGSNGTALVSVSGGTTDYTFNWTPVGGTDSLATGLAPGTYTCVVTDANGCTRSDIVTISEPAPLSVSSSHTNLVCNGGTNGTATVIVSGGTSPYSYAWSPSGGTAATATNLTAGSYTCLITDAGGCTYSQTFTIAQPSALTATTSQTNVGCNGGSNGTATVIVNGGSPFYTYNWLPTGGTGPIATGLSAITYTCSVTDANGCTMTQTVTITEPPVLSATISSTNTNCGQNNGTATIIPAGGTAPYSYAWSPAGGNTAIATGILAGTYTCTLTDAMACSGTYTVTVNDTPAPVISLLSQTNILCNGGNTGDATVLASGGVGTLTYAWLPFGGTAATASSLTAGTYTCTVTDSAGCTQTQTVTITEPALLTATSTSGSVLCNGGTTTVTVVASGGVSPYTGEGIFTEVAGTYTYPVTDANGCTTSTSITITEPTLLTISAIPASILCNGGSTNVIVTASGGTGPYTGEGTFIEVAGTYTYTVTDANGCTVSTSLTLTEPALLSASSTATSVLCNGGNAIVTVTAVGGTSPYTGTGTFTELAGTFTYLVTDANGCTTSTSVTVTEPTALVSVVDSVTNPSGCSATDGMIYISVSGGTAAYTYLWTNSSALEDLAGVGAGTYSCTITDANGCTSTVNAALVDPAPPVVSVVIDTTLCSLDAPYTLTEGNPVGGIWSGTGISGNTFDPATAGIGSFVLTYTYTAANGCSAFGSDTIVVDACIGIDNNTISTSWSVYPNPTFGEVSLSGTGNQTENHLVEVYSSEGKLILSENFNAGQQIKLNMIDQAAGIYLVKISSDSEISTVRIIKQ